MEVGSGSALEPDLVTHHSQTSDDLEAPHGSLEDYRPVVADSHRFDEEKNADLHRREKLDFRICIEVKSGSATLDKKKKNAVH